jgi:S1-C subfamily serine protease
VDTVYRTVPQLIQHGRVIRPALGIAAVPDQIADQLGITGVIVLDVARGGAADKAGLRPTRRDRYGDLILGDVIRKVDGKKVNDFNDLLDVLESHQIGQTVPIEVHRDGRARTVKVTLEASR